MLFDSLKSWPQQPNKFFYFARWVQENTICLGFSMKFCCWIFWIFLFSVRLLLVLRGHSFFHPHHNDQWPPASKDFLSQILSITFISSERASIFPFECSVLNKGTTGTIYITSLVWRGPWLGIEPGTTRFRSQHSTTRLWWSW